MNEILARRGALNGLGVSRIGVQIYPKVEKLVEKTPWFEPHINPVRIGNYECYSCGDGHFHYWNGTSWQWDEDTIGVPGFGPAMWRGLTNAG